MADNPITVPLPQDLPTNWSLDQTVSPSGTDVGLTAQHGYNYLNTQVNAAQQAAQELGEAFPDLYAAGDTIPVADGGTGIGVNPSMLVNLGSTAADTVFKTLPRPGVTGTLPITNGGTGITNNPSMLVNLGSTNAASVLATSPRPGVTGILPAANGGTGNANGQAASAQKLVTARNIQVNLGSTAAAAFDGTRNVTPGVTGTLPIANGGTGASTAQQALANLGAVNISGATMTGNLEVLRSYATFKATDPTSGRSVRIISNPTGTVAIHNYQDDNDYRGIVINPDATDLTQMLRLQNKVGNNIAFYPIIHTGNISAYNIAQIETGSYTGTGGFLSVHNQITFSLSNTVNTVIITGGSNAAPLVLSRNMNPFPGGLSGGWGVSTNSVNWWSTNNATEQYNESGVVYGWIAFA